jgi:hypothetical protein
MNFHTRVLISLAVHLVLSFSARAATPDTATPDKTNASATSATVATPAASVKSAAPVVARPAAISLYGATTLTLDATCINPQEGALDILVRNNTTKALPLSLRVGDFVNASAPATLSAQVTEALFRSDGRTVFRASTIKAKETIDFRVSVFGVSDEGEWRAELYNDNDKIGTLSVVRVLPFNVDLDLPKSRLREISVQKGEPLLLPFKNSDLLAYSVKVDLTVAHHSLSDSLTLSPKGIAPATFDTKTLLPWFDTPWEGYFRTETVTGRLLVALQSRTCPSDLHTTGSAPPVPHFKEIPLAVHLKYHSPGVNFFAIAVVLFAGALCSLVIGSFLPNQLRRIQLKRDLDAMAARIRDLPMQLSSRLRVSLGLDEKRCFGALTSQAAFAPGFAGVLTEVKKRMDSLEKRLKLTEQLASLRVRFEAQRLRSLFPTPMNTVAADFDAAVDLLRGVEVSDDDIQAAQALVKSLADQIRDLDDIKRTGSDLISQIKARAARLLLGSETATAPNNYFSKWPAEVSSASLHGGCRLAEAMLDELRFRRWRSETSKLQLGTIPVPHSVSDSVSGFSSSEFLEEDLPDVDRLSLKLEMLRDCARLDNGDRLFGKSFADLVKHLESQNAERFDAAKRLAQEIKERVFAEDVVREIVEGAKDEAADAEEHVDIRDYSESYWPVGNRLIRAGLVILCLLFFVRGRYELAWISFAALIVAIVAARGVAAAAGALLDWIRPRSSGEAVVADRNRVRIEIETTQVYTYGPIQLRVLFSREDLNRSEAIKDFVPVWNFGHDALTDEYGWEVVHYFPRARSYIVTVRFQKREGNFVRLDDLPRCGPAATVDSTAAGVEGKRPSGTAAATLVAARVLAAGQRPPAVDLDQGIVLIKRRVQVMRMRRSNRWSAFLEAAQLLVAIVPALFAVRSGVLGELSKQSLLSGLIGVFVIGFTSDRIKSLLTQKTP